MNDGKLSPYFKSRLYAIMSNMTHFLIPFGMTEKWPVLNSISTVLMQNLEIRNFHSSMALNNAKKFDILKTIGMRLCQI